MAPFVVLVPTSDDNTLSTANFTNITKEITMLLASVVQLLMWVFRDMQYGGLWCVTLPSVFGSTPAHLMWQFYVGLGLAISSSIFIGTSFILKKKALIRLANNNTSHRAVGVGEACNFAAYAFVPASLVTPLGALSVLVTTVLSSRLLREKLNLLGKIGCAVCLLGSTVVVLHAPKEDNVQTMVELGEKMQHIGFIVYVVVILAASIYLAVIVAPRHGTQNILVFIGICSLIGSLSVLGCKGFGLAIKETIEGDNQLTNVLTWFWLVSIVVCVSVQLNYLNKSLDVFNTAMVTPVYYVCFTTSVIVASGILYNEWAHMGVIDIIGNVVGMLTTVIGIFQMQLFKDYNVTLRQLRHLLWKNNNGQNGSSPVLLRSREDTPTSEYPMNGVVAVSDVLTQSATQQLQGVTISSPDNTPPLSHDQERVTLLDSNQSVTTSYIPHKHHNGIVHNNDTQPDLNSSWNASHW